MRYKYILKIALASAAVVVLLSSCTEKPVLCPSIDVRVKAADTKAATTTTSSLEEYGKFAMEAYMDDDWKEYNADGSVKTTGAAGMYFTSGGSANVLNKGGVWTITPEQKWIAEDLTRFWCFAPIEVNGTRAYGDMHFATEAGTAKMTFAYEMAAAGQVVAGSKIDADKCDDIIFAYAEKNYTSSSTSFIDLTFQHALAKICFCISPDDATFDTGLKIKDITVNGVYPAGACTFDGNGTIDAGTMFVWTPSGTKADYAQTYNATFNKKPEDWSEGTFKESALTYKKYTCDNAFFFVPQNIGSSTTVTVTFVDGETEIPVTKALASDVEPTAWTAGRYYNYKIAATTLGRTIKVTVSLDDWDNYDDKLLL